MTSLTLAANGATPTAIKELARSPDLEHVRSLAVYCDEPAPNGLGRPLIDSQWLCRLERLDLRNMGLDDRDLATLASSDRFLHLTSLRLDGNSFTANGLARLFAAPIDQLAELSILCAGLVLTPELAKRLTEASFFTELHTLAIYDAGGAAVVRAARNCPKALHTYRGQPRYENGTQIPSS